MIDHLFVKSPNCRMLRREGVVMSLMNETIAWLADKPLSMQAEVMKSALDMRKRLERVDAEERVELARKIGEEMLERDEEVKRREQKRFERLSALATVVAEVTVYWRTIEAMDQALGGMKTDGED